MSDAAQVKERPMLFSAPMVRALLDGTKTQTRRIVNANHLRQIDLSSGDLVANWSKPMPYGKPGERLWVRESMYLHQHAGARGGWLYSADNAQVTVNGNDDESVLAMRAWAHHKMGGNCPSIHMPRWASRILLEITDVRVERLTSISPWDCEAEGVTRLPLQEGELNPWWTADVSAGPSLHSRSALGAYHKLWDHINGTGAWDANPWVWAISFKRIKP